MDCEHEKGKERGYYFGEGYTRLKRAEYQHKHHFGTVRKYEQKGGQFIRCYCSYKSEKPQPVTVNEPCRKESVE